MHPLTYLAFSKLRSILIILTHNRSFVPTGTIIDLKVVSRYILVYTHEVRGDGEGKKVLYCTVLYCTGITLGSAVTKVFGIRATLSVGYGSLRENHATDAVLYLYIHLRLPVKGVDQFLSKLSKADQAPSP